MLRILIVLVVCPDTLSFAFILLSLPLLLQLHLFDGLAMLTKLRVADGKVWGSQKYINSEQYR